MARPRRRIRRDLGFEHSGVRDHGAYGSNIDLPDPDGTVLRFLADNVINAGQFIGVDTVDGTPGIYAEPRLLS